MVFFLLLRQLRKEYDIGYIILLHYYNNLALPSLILSVTITSHASFSFEVIGEPQRILLSPFPNYKSRKSLCYISADDRRLKMHTNDPPMKIVQEDILYWNSAHDALGTFNFFFTKYLDFGLYNSIIWLYLPYLLQRQHTGVSWKPKAI